MSMIDLDDRLIRLLEHRDFFDPDEDDKITVEPDDIVLDVLILARVKKSSEVGTSESGLVIMSDNNTDNIMVSGMLHLATTIQDMADYQPREPDED